MSLAVALAICGALASALLAHMVRQEGLSSWWLYAPPILTVTAWRLMLRTPISIPVLSVVLDCVVGSVYFLSLAALGHRLGAAQGIGVVLVILGLALVVT